MPNINHYGRIGAEFRVGQVVRLKATAGPALRHGDTAKIVEIRDGKVLVHVGYGAHYWLGREKVQP